jgi:uncharacterized glyoxalase superfamily protein PhnB
MIANRSAPTALSSPSSCTKMWKPPSTLVHASGCAERLRARGPDGRVSHAQLRAGSGDVIIGCQGGPFRIPRADEATHMVHVAVADVDDHWRHAQHYGADILEPPTDKPFGERQYTARDPGGHWWTFSQHIADVAPSAWGAVEALPGAVAG